jgi:hypothetical protein
MASSVPRSLAKAKPLPLKLAEWIDYAKRMPEDHPSMVLEQLKARFEQIDKLREKADARRQYSCVEISVEMPVSEREVYEFVMHHLTWWFEPVRCDAQETRAIQAYRAKESKAAEASVTPTGHRGLDGWWHLLHPKMKIVFCTHRCSACWPACLATVPA